MPYVLIVNCTVNYIVKSLFRIPDVVSPLDAIVTFKALTPEAMETIVDKFILQLEASSPTGASRLR